MTKDTIQEFDKKHLWHPYASAFPEQDCLLISKAEGVRLYLDDNTSLIDGMSSWWAVIHGYNHPRLNKALNNQLKKMAHVMFGGLTHTPAVELAQILLKIVPKGLEHIFYADSGSVAVEVAMKMALQYWQSKNLIQKTQFATIKKGYHGDTWHAMSVCDPETGMHKIFNNRLSIQHFLPSPKSKFNEEFNIQEIDSVKNFFEENHKTLAAFILEPIVQGAGGMRFYHPNYLKTIRELCSTYHVLLIADEIATGFGRTGKMFACEHAEISPDIMCLGKAIAGGYMSFAATLCTQNIAETISNGDVGLFMHGPTFMGNPLACALGAESIKLLIESSYDIAAIEKELQNGLMELKHHVAVADVRVLGAIGVIEMRDNVDMLAFRSAMLQEGIWLRPFGKLIYTMPPFVISKNDLQFLCKGIRKIIYKIYS